MILYCACVHREHIPANVRADVLAGLSSCGTASVAVADLCALAARRDPRLADWAHKKALTIVACRPRAIRWLFDWAGAPLREAATLLDMRDLSAAQIVAALPRGRARATAKLADIKERGPWVPWFPVLDRGRCVNCKQCASFCAFGVYTVTDNRVLVQHPDKCKNNCPACARMCPHVAIIFPKCTEVPIDGAAVSAEHVQQRREAAGKQTAAGNDLRALLARRKPH